MSASFAVVLAAGKGTRMRSDLPKALHELGGEPLVFWPIRAARAAGVESVVVVVGHQAELVQDRISRAFSDDWLRFALQAEQRGTGHAVQCALPAVEGLDGPVLILSGDVPFVRPETLVALRSGCERSAGGLALATFRPPTPDGYGRVVRDPEGRVTAVIEHRDASETQRAIEECNAGIYCVRADRLRVALPTIGATNAQGEVYLTDLVARLSAGGEVAAVSVSAGEVAGVNTDEQLQTLERELAGA